MGLQVWLPMNGNLNNYGLSDLTFNVITPTTINNSGKIGSCYENTSYTTGGVISNETIVLGNNQSMCAWIYMNSIYSSANLMGIGGQHRYSSKIGMGLTIRYVSSTTGYLSVNTGTGSSRTFNTYYGSTLLNTNQWYHVAYTYDGTYVRLYVNGVLDGTYNVGTLSNPADYIGIFCWSLNGTSGNVLHNSYQFNGRINDFRIYDHTLTANEVKKISQGLILHYPLSDRYNEPTTNLLPTNLQNFSMSGYDALSFSCNTSQHGKYTLSGYLTVQTNSDWVSPRITITGYYSDGSNVGLASNFNIIKDGKEHFIETTGQTDTSKTLVAIKGWVLDHSSGGSHKYATGRNFQLEFKDHPTPYTSSSRDDHTVYDVSGYNRNGLITGAFSISNNTIKYKVSTLFDGSSYITLDSLPAETKTISCWVKTTKNKSTSQIMFCDYNTKLCMSFYSGCIISYFGSGAGTGSKCTLGSEYKENNWNHIVIVVTGSNTRDVYVNGVKLTPTSNDYWADTSTGMTIGRRNTASNSLPFYGYLSDFRAYATALSADDILELYKTPSYLASNAS